MDKRNGFLAKLLPSVCIALFLFVLLQYSKYSIAFKEQASIFFFGPGCLDRYVYHPALFASALGDLLTRFFMIEWVAVAISMFFVLLLWLGIHRFMRIIGTEESCCILGIIPVAVECIFLSFPNYPLSATIGLTIGVWAACAVGQIRKNKPRNIAYLVSVPVLFVLAGGPASIVFALLLIPILGKDERLGKRVGKKDELLFAVAIVLFWIMSCLYGMDLTQSGVYPVIKGYITPAPVLIALNPVLIALLVWIADAFVIRNWVAIIVSFLSVGLVWQFKASRNLESSIEIGTHAYYGEWDKVREMSRRGESNQYGLYFYNLSYAREGKLPDNLLSVEQNRLSDGLFLSSEKGESYLSSYYWSMGLMEMGDFAQANDAALLAQTVMPGGYSSRMMRTLAEIAVASGEYDVALKYLDILSRTPGHRAWASALKGNVMTGKIPERYLDLQSRSSINEDVMFAQGDIRTSLKNIADASPVNKIAMDYLMCSALLEKRINTFIGMYERWYLKKLDRYVDVPALYEEALLVNVNSQESLLECAERYMLSEETVDRYLEFLTDQVKAEGDLTKLRKYSGTYWYYIMSVNFTKNEDK